MWGTDGGSQVGGVDGHAALWRGTAESMVDLHPAGFTSSWATGVAGEQQNRGGGRNRPGAPQRALAWVWSAQSGGGFTPPRTTHRAFVYATHRPRPGGSSPIPG